MFFLGYVSNIGSFISQMEHWLWLISPYICFKNNKKTNHET